MEINAIMHMVVVVTHAMHEPSLSVCMKIEMDVGGYGRTCGK